MLGGAPTSTLSNNTLLWDSIMPSNSPAVCWPDSSNSECILYISITLTSFNPQLALAATYNLSLHEPRV